MNSIDLRGSGNETFLAKLAPYQNHTLSDAYYKWFEKPAAYAPENLLYVTFQNYNRLN